MAGMHLQRSRPRLAGDGVGGLVVALNQRAECVDEVFDLGLLYPEEIKLPRDLVKLRHGLFVGDAIGIHFCLLHWAQCSTGIH